MTSLVGGRLSVPEAVVCNPLGHAPLRRPGSVRRTATTDMSWPNGPGGRLSLQGLARDILTAADGVGFDVLAVDRLSTVCRDRIVESIEAEPARPGMAALCGARPGGQLREIFDRIQPDERRQGTPLYLLLDDLAGANIIANWAWTRWPGTPLGLTDDEVATRIRRMEGVCIGFRPGSGAVGTHGHDRVEQSFAHVPSVLHPDDPDGWHALTTPDVVSMRRARRIDLWRDGDVVRIDASFQDSAAEPDGVRSAIHEYHLTATVDAKGDRLLSVSAEPRILPYRECPAAAANVGALVGTPLSQLREAALAVLRKTAGCTHLNDALRALAEAPRLIRSLPPA